LARIEICGLAPSEKRKPHPSENEAWGLPWSPLAHRYSRWFEMHDRSLWERRGPKYLDILRNAEVPIYMQREEPDIPNSVCFPLDQAIEIGGDYFNSSIAYMLALAAVEGHGVELWGVVNSIHDEFAYERPCNEWWLGIIKGRGADVWVHPDSYILKFMPHILFLDERQKYIGRYGWLQPS
jgi:hypothetical protein